MRFFKEYIIVLVILIIVFVINFITSKKLENAIGWMDDGMESIGNKISENKEDDAKKEFYELEDKWKSETEKLSYFVEHNELEKVSREVIIVEANFSINDSDKIIESINELKFLLEHIEDKNKLKLKNIF